VVLRHRQECLDTVERTSPDCEVLLHKSYRLSRIVDRRKRS